MNWTIDTDKLEEAGIKPGVYEHFKGGEYLTVTAGWRMSQKGTDETVGTKVVVYVALYDHPKYGNSAVWDRSIEGFKEQVTIDGKEVPRFRFVRSTTEKN
jgi:hypothetical protein